MLACVRKKYFKHYRLSLKEGIFNFNNFWYKYFWHNWPSNDSLIHHFTQCLLLHYLGKLEQAKLNRIQYFIGFVSPGSAKTNNGCGAKLDSHSIASCVRNIDVKNYQNLVVLLQVANENVQNFFSGHGVHVFANDTCAHSTM